MVSKNFIVLFFLKKPPAYNKGTQPIYLRITVDGRRAEISVKRECEPVRWNGKAGKVIGTREDAKSLNAYLDTLKQKVYEAYCYLLDRGEVVTAERIKGVLTGVTEQPRMFLEIFAENNRQMEALVGQGFAPPYAEPLHGGAGTHPGLSPL